MPTLSHSDRGGSSPATIITQRHSKPRPAPIDVSLGQMFWLGLAIGVATGLIESAAWAVRKFVAGEFIFSNNQLFWMLPIAQAALFCLLALPLGLIALLTRQKINISLCTTWLCFFAIWEALQHVPGIHPLARYVLAAGIAWQVYVPSARWGGSLLVAARHTACAGLIVVGGLFLAIAGFDDWWQHKQARQLPPAAPGSPNVLLIVLDTVRRDAIDLGEANSTGFVPARTPTLERIAAECTVFDQALSTAPWTLPSHASMFTGHYPHELSASWRTPLDDRYLTLAQRLQHDGYVTGGFVGNLRYTGSETGLDRGFIRYEDYPINITRFLMGSAIGRQLLIAYKRNTRNKLERKDAQAVTGGFLNWLDKRVLPDERRPFFAFLNYFDAHDPYVPPAEFARREPRDADQHRIIRDWWHVDKPSLTHEQVDLGREAYLDCITFLDHHLGMLLDELKARGILDDTILIVTGDHGEHFGDHELFGHGNSLYQPLVHVPLMIRWPAGVPAGVRLNDCVSLRDLPQTILELTSTRLGTFVSSPPPRVAGTAGERPDEGNNENRRLAFGHVLTTNTPNDDTFPGKSLTRFWNSEASRSEQREYVMTQIAQPSRFPPCHGQSPIFRGPMKSIVEDSIKYIRAGEESEELYDLSQDVNELTNRIDDPAYAEPLRRLRVELDRTVDR